LTIDVSNPQGTITNVQVRFDGLSGSFENQSPDPPATYVFNIDGTVYGSIDIRNELQTTGEIKVSLRLVGGGTPGNDSFQFDKSTLNSPLLKCPLIRLGYRRQPSPRLTSCRRTWR
jgi:hypothetical protein